MKQQYQDLGQLYQELDRQHAMKRDFITNTEDAVINPDLSMSIGSVGFEGRMNDHMMRQVGSWADVPARYIDHMKTQGMSELLAHNLNSWMQNPPKSKKGRQRSNRRMFRTFDGDGNITQANYMPGGPVFRAFLSDQFRVFDCFDLLQGLDELLDELDKDMGGLKFGSLGLTESKMYLKIIFPGIEADVAVGDTVQAGVIITNSDIGAGAIGVKGFINRLICLNGMTVDNSGLRKTHLGTRSEDVGEINYQSDTVDAMNLALSKQLRDTVRKAASEVKFLETVDQMREAANSPQVHEPEKAVELVAKKFHLSDGEEKQVRKSFYSGGGGRPDFSKWGMLNAVTHVSNDVESYDRASELEKIGGRILTIPQNEWAEIALAA